MIKKVRISTKKDLEIYMNPVRQQLLRQLEISKEPMTPKMLAEKLNISASGVQHHIRKLLSLELVELDHTKLINGITASFYKAVNATVQICMDLTDESVLQREILLQGEISMAFNGYVAQRKKLKSRFGDMDMDALQKWGAIMTGVMHLTDEEGHELMRMIFDYVKNHALPAEDRFPWEFALILYSNKDIDA